MGNESNNLDETEITCLDNQSYFEFTKDHEIATILLQNDLKTQWI